MKTALVHDWFLTQGGAEKVFTEIWKLFPGHVYSLFYDKNQCHDLPFKEGEITCSFLQNLPFVSHYYRSLLPLFPKAIESIDITGADLIISSSHAVAKGIKKKENQLHISYCYTPMRYAWDLKQTYLAPFDPIRRKTYSFLLDRLKSWDLATTSRVDLFLTSSAFVAKRIASNYQRKAIVIYPPVPIEDFHLSSAKDHFYMTHCRLVPYKKVDVLIKAFQHLPDKTLLVIGDGPDACKLKAIAPKNVEFLGKVSNDMLKHLLSRAKGYLFAAEEDFGLGVVEAQASGTPVIALGKGGALETVTEGVSGLFFSRAHEENIISAIKVFEKKEDTFDPALIRKSVERFALARFQKEFSSCIENAYKDFYEDRDSSRRKWL